VPPGDADTWAKRLDVELARGQRLGYDVAAADMRLTDHVTDGWQLKSLTFGLKRGGRNDTIARPGMTLIPGLALTDGFTALALHDPSLLVTAQTKALYSDYEQAALAAGVEEGRPSLSSLDKTVSAAQTSFAAFTARGGQVVLGSGAPGVPYGLGFLVECTLAQGSGLNALRVLQVVTTDAAAALGVSDRLGTVAPGKLADLAIIDGDPLKTVSDLAKVAGVVVNGRYFISEELLRQ